MLVRFLFSSYLCPQFLTKSMFTTKNEITFLLFTAPAITTLVAAFILFLFYRHSRSKQALATMLTVVGVCMIAYCVSDYYIYGTPYAINRFFDSWSGLLISPFLLYYFSTLMRPGEKHGRLLLRWLIPAFVSMPLYFLIVALWGEYPETYDWDSFMEVFWHPEPLTRIATLVMFTSEIVVFTYYIFGMAREHERQIRYDYSYTEKINLRWVYYICVLMQIFGALAILGIVTSGFEYKVLFSFFTFFIMLTIFIFGAKQQDVQVVEEEITAAAGEVSGEAAAPGVGAVPGTEAAIEETAATITVTEEGASATLNEHEHSEKTTSDLRQRLVNYFEDEKPHLDSDLTLVKLAQAMKVNRTYLSNTINREMGTTFYGFVNRYRLAHALKMLESGKHTLSEAITASGFKSKSGFYNLFRQEYGCTPGEYLKGNTGE